MDKYESMISSFNQNVESNEIPVFESYYGKLPEFDYLEQNFRGIIDKAQKEKNKCNPNKYQENKNICKIFEKLFGFKKVYLYWIPSEQLNAFTINVQSLILFGESRDFIEKRSNKGFYDNSHRSVLTVYVYTGMLNKKIGFTERELCAIILHEIGHNFDYSMYHAIEFITDAILTLGLSADWALTNRMIEDHNSIKMKYYNDIESQSTEIYKDQKTRDKQADNYKRDLDRYFKAGWFKGILRLINANLAHLIYLPFAIPLQFLSLGGHKGEQFADSFATSYGYGTDLVSGLEKMSEFYQPTKATHGLQVLEDLTNASYEIFIGMSGEVHGTNQERIKECIKKLKSDLAKEDYPPGMKEELENEIVKIENRYHDLLTAAPNDKLKITKLWRRICNVIFGGANNISKLFKANKV